MLGCGPEKLRESNQRVLNKTSTLREEYQFQYDSITYPWPTCMKQVLPFVEFDPQFASFYKWATSNNIPVVILSAGLKPMISDILHQFLGPEAENIEVIANDIALREEFSSICDDAAKWEVKFWDDSDLGHDKGASIRPYKEHREQSEGEDEFVLLYAGDGVSDLHAAREADVLFAKEGRELADHCEQGNIPYVQYRDWRKILEVTKEIYYEKKTLGQVVEDDMYRSQP